EGQGKCQRRDEGRGMRDERFASATIAVKRSLHPSSLFPYPFPFSGIALALTEVMRHRTPHERRCTYVVPLEEQAAGSADDLRALSEYLSTLAVADCDVLILDAASAEEFERNRTVLRWVGRHVAVDARNRTASGAIDPVRAAVASAPCEKVIVAAPDIRYTADEIAAVCDLLDLHEVVEPQDYLDPLPWWGGIEAGRMLVHRSIEPYPDHGATFGFRRSAIRGLRSLDAFDLGDDHV